MRGLRIPTAKGTRVIEHRTRIRKKTHPHGRGTMISISSPDFHGGVIVNPGRPNQTTEGLQFMREWDLVRIRLHCKNHGWEFLILEGFEHEQFTS